MNMQDWEATKGLILFDFVATMLEYYGDDEDASEKQREPFQITVYDLIRAKDSVYHRLKITVNSWADEHKELIENAWSELGLSNSGQRVKIGVDLFCESMRLGVGFRDGDYFEFGDKLADAANDFPSYEFYVGDDGDIYESPPAYLEDNALTLISYLESDVL